MLKDKNEGELMMDRQTAREEAFKHLFQRNINDQVNTAENMNNYTKKLVQGVSEHIEEIDQLISTHLENWTLDRIALVEKTILRIATYELKFTEDIPVAVAINEAVELGHKYGDEKSSKFINGVLSKIIK